MVPGCLFRYRQTSQREKLVYNGGFQTFTVNASQPRHMFPNNETEYL